MKGDLQANKPLLFGAGFVPTFSHLNLFPSIVAYSFPSLSPSQKIAAINPATTGWKGEGDS